MDINQMEFQWHLNWWYRPTQLDGFGTSVADYCDCFCDWKANMELNSCPAVEPDYVDAFIQNLRFDIRSRLESKGRPRTRRLSDAFYDAKLEECLISMEEVFKNFEAKFEARNMFDKMPSQISVDSQEFLVSSHSFSLPVSPADSSNELAEISPDIAVIEAEEFSGLKDAESSCLEEAPSITEVLQVQIESEKETHKLLDEFPEVSYKLNEFPESVLDGSLLIDQVLGKDNHNSDNADETTIEVAGYVDELLELEEKRDYGGQQSSPLVIVSSGDVNIDNSSEEKRERAENVVQALGMVHNSTEVISMGSKSISGQCDLFSMFSKGELSSCRAVTQSDQPYPSKDGMVEVVYEVFDKGSKRISLKVDCLSARLNVLDVMSKPNSSAYQSAKEYYEPAIIELVKINEKQFGEVVVFMFDPGIHSWVLYGCASNNSSDMSSHSNVELLLGNMLPFDPGGCLSKLSIMLSHMHSVTLDSMTRHEPYGRAVLYYKGHELLWPTRARQTFAFCDFWVAEWINAEVQLCWTEPCSHSENSLVYSTFGELKKGIYLANHGALFLFAPCGNYHLLRAWHWNDDFEICKEQQGHNTMRKNGYYVLFSFDPGGNTSSHQNTLLHEVAHHIEPLVVGLICDRLIGFILAFGTEMVWQHVVVLIQKLRGIKGASFMISIAHFIENFWVTIFGSNVKDSSAANKMEGYRLGILLVNILGDKDAFEAEERRWLCIGVMCASMGTVR